ncbi:MULTISPECIES: hypothetical protein [Mycobacteroides]|nr:MULTISPECIES: hypothetical protein [Mycobacteroides]
MQLFPHEGLLAILEVNSIGRPKLALPPLDMIRWQRCPGPPTDLY